MVTRYIKDSKLNGAGDSVVGQVRAANEDNCGYSSTPNGELFVVCDGMGGHVGGATASRIAVDSIITYINDHSVDDKRILLKDALLFANMQILGTANADATLRGMGTTACIVLIDNDKSWIAHVGDSRIYLFSEKEKYLYRITKDHSLVQSLVDQGQLDDREAEHHPQKNIILRALGTKVELIPEVDEVPIRPIQGDTFLICSDGLSGMIDDNEIEQTLLTELSVEDKVQELISKANAPEKGLDNITVQLIKVLNSSNEKSIHPNYNPTWRLKGPEKLVEQIKVNTHKISKKTKLSVLIGGGVTALLLIGILILVMGKGTPNPPSNPIESPKPTIEDPTKIDSGQSSATLKKREITIKAGENANLRLCVNNPANDTILWEIHPQPQWLTIKGQVVSVAATAPDTVVQFIMKNKKSDSQASLKVIVKAKKTIDNSIEMHRKDSIEKHRKDSIEMHRKDSIEKYQRDSIEKHQRDSIEKYQRDSIEKHLRDSIEKYQRDSIEKHLRDSIEKYQRDSIAKHQRDSLNQGSTQKTL